MTRFTLHPLVIAILTMPAMLAVLIAHRPWFALVALGCCMLASLGCGLRIAALFVGATALLLLITWFGMQLWLPPEAALNGTARIVAAAALLVTPALFVNGPVLADTLIDRFHAPYRVMDIFLIGERYSALLRTDLRLSSHIAGLRARTRALHRVRLLLRTMLPVLIASFRHSEELAIAMDARGFGTHPTRTVHQSRTITALDIVALVAVWAASIALAALLGMAG